MEDKEHLGRTETNHCVAVACPGNRDFLCGVGVEAVYTQMTREEERQAEFCSRKVGANDSKNCAFERRIRRDDCLEIAKPDFGSAAG